MKDGNININQLADAPNLEMYQSKPVENFGLSLLKNMGFDEKEGIGKNNKKSTSILILKPRPKGLGLGAENQQTKTLKKLKTGDLIQIHQGNHKDMIGQVLEFNNEQVSVELEPSKSVVKIKSEQVKTISEEQFQIILLEFEKQKGQEKKPKRLKWILPQIKIKVIDKTSKHYLKKTIVTQLLSERKFQCRDIEGNFINDLREKDVQTVIPDIGRTVLILQGEYKGVKATLLERKKGKNKIIVQTNDELEVVKLTEDDAAEYIQL